MMLDVNFLAWTLEAAGILVGAFGILALSTFIYNRIKRKYWRGDDTAELILCVVLTIACIQLFNMVPNKEKRFEIFYAMKPKCQEETIDCLKKKAEWYQDSIDYNVNIQAVDEKYIIDSLKNVINNYEKGK